MAGVCEVVAVEALEPIIDVIARLVHEPPSRLDRFDQSRQSRPHHRRDGSIRPPTAGSCRDAMSLDS